MLYMQLSKRFIFAELKNISRIVDRKMGLVQFIEFCGKHPFATGLFAVVGALGFAFSIYAFGIDRFESKSTQTAIESVERQVEEARTALIDVNENVSRLSLRPSPPKDDRAGFEGNWSDQKAFEVVWPNPQTETGDEKIVKTFFSRLRNKDIRVLVTAPPPCGFQPCGTELSLFIFEDVGSAWKLQYAARKFGQFSRTGDDVTHYIRENMDIWEMGPDRLGFVVPGTFWYQAVCSQGYSIYSFVGDEMVKVFSGTVNDYTCGTDREEYEAMGAWAEHKWSIETDKSHSKFGMYRLSGRYTGTNVEGYREVFVDFDGERYPYVSFDDLKYCLESIAPSSTYDASKCKSRWE